MDLYNCALYLRNTSFESRFLIETLKKTLGFVPARIYAVNENGKCFDDINYDDQVLLEIAAVNNNIVQISNGLFEESKPYFWGRVVVDQTFGLTVFEWHNQNLDFLLDSNELQDLLSTPTFFYGIVYNNDDKFQQSDVLKSGFLGHPYNELLSKQLQFIEKTGLWGASLRVCGVQFMAAPRMWFGSEWLSSISEDLFLLFQYSELVSVNGNRLFHINLFPIYTKPSEIEHRERQRMFWEHFNFGNVIKNYSKEWDTGEIDLKSFFATKGSKKK